MNQSDVFPLDFEPEGSISDATTMRSWQQELKAERTIWVCRELWGLRTGKAAKRQWWPRSC